MALLRNRKLELDHTTVHDAINLRYNYLTADNSSFSADRNGKTMVFAYPISPPYSYPCAFKQPIPPRCNTGIAIQVILYTAKLMGFTAELMLSSGFGIGLADGEALNTTMSLVALNKAEASGPNFFFIPARTRYTTTSAPITYTKLGVAIQTPGSVDNVSYSIFGFGDKSTWYVQMSTILVVLIIHYVVRFPTARLRISRKCSNFVIASTGLYVGMFLNLYSSQLSIDLFRDDKPNEPFDSIIDVRDEVIAGNYRAAVLRSTAESKWFYDFIKMETGDSGFSKAAKNVIPVDNLNDGLKLVGKNSRTLLVASVADLTMVALPCAGFTVIAGEKLPNYLMGYFFPKSYASVAKLFNIEIANILRRHNHFLIQREINEREFKLCFMKNVSSREMESWFRPMKLEYAWTLSLPMFTGMSLAVVSGLLELLTSYRLNSQARQWDIVII